MTAHGRLEKVDLRSHEFRVCDDVGNSVDLKNVRDDVTAALLVGQWVAARGIGTVLTSGRLVALQGVAIEAVDDPGASSALLRSWHSTSSWPAPQVLTQTGA